MIKIYIDKRTELLGLILRLSNYAKVVSNMYDKIVYADYGEECLRYLEPYKGHETIKLLNLVLDEYGDEFAYGRPITLFMQMDENFQFKGEKDYPFATRLKSSSSILNFLESIPRFAKDINFDKFYEEHKPFYQNCINAYAKMLGPKEQNLFKFMENFYMSKPNEENYAVNLLLHQASGSHGIKTGDIFYCHDGTYLEIPQNPTENQCLSWVSYVLHEFSHPIINPLTEKQKLKAKDVPAYPNNSMCDCYTGVSTYVNESIIRAIQTYFLEKEVNRQLPNCYANHKRVGFPLVEALVQKLHEMENKNYNNFTEKYLELLDFLKQDIKDIEITSHQQ